MIASSRRPGVFVLLLFVLVAACGGGGGSSSHTSPSPTLQTHTDATNGYAIGIPSNWQIVDVANLKTSISDLTTKHPKWTTYTTGNIDTLDNPSAGVKVIAVDPLSADNSKPEFFFVTSYNIPVAAGTQVDLPRYADLFLTALLSGDTLGNSTLKKQPVTLPGGSSILATFQSNLGGSTKWSYQMYFLARVVGTQLTVYVIALATTLDNDTAAGPGFTSIAQSFKIL